MLTLAPPGIAVAAAIAVGLPSADARRASRDDALLGITVTYPGGGADSAVGRVDGGTATAELQFTPLGTAPDERVASPLAALARDLLDADRTLRRVSVTVPARLPVAAALVASGFADEGWAPPVGEWSDSRMFTYLR